MNATRNRVAATFAPETRFEVWPTPGTPFRANLETEFERLKNRLLARELETIEQPGLNAPLRRAANEAAELFEEKARLAVQQAVRQARILAETGELAVAA
jgi:hypothetical protein